MAKAKVNGIEIYYETAGDPSGVPLLLVMGLGGQIVGWDPDIVAELVDRGFFVVTFDNRDVGLSTSFSDSGFDATAAMMGLMGGEEVDPPYVLGDMAADAAGLLAHLDLESAHVLGVSMGGMIVQQLAIDHSDSVRTLTSIMSTTGDPDVGAPTADALTQLMGAFTTPVATRDEALAQSRATWEVIGSPGLIDWDAVDRRAGESYDRNPDASGTLRQMVAILASPARSEALSAIDIPSLVVHGTVDPLVQPSGGERTAEVIAGARLVMIDGMAHDLPRVKWPQLLEAFEAHTGVTV